MMLIFLCRVPADILIQDTIFYSSYFFTFKPAFTQLPLEIIQHKAMRYNQNILSGPIDIIQKLIDSLSRILN